jgi:hypothetical protein
MNRIYPRERFQNIKKCATTTLSLPITYLIIPFSCCIRHPLAKHIYEHEEPNTSSQKMGETFSIGMLGVFSWLTCGLCCFGCCGSCGPNDI